MSWSKRKNSVTDTRLHRIYFALGIAIWYKADPQDGYPPLFLKLLSIITIVFFGGGGLLLLYRMADKGSGLILDNYGIQLNYGGNKNPLTIEWRNITGVEIKEIRRTKILLVFINNPEELINKESMWKQRLMRLGLKMYGTPISLSTGTFNCVLLLMSW